MLCPRCKKNELGIILSSSRTADETDICNDCGREQAMLGLQRPGDMCGPIYERIIWDIAHSETLQQRLEEVLQLLNQGERS